MKKLRYGNLFIVIISTKLNVFYNTSTYDDLRKFGKTKWPDNLGHHLYYQRYNLWDSD